MDLLPSVDLLRDHLVAHDRAVQEIIALDMYIEQQCQQTYLSTMGEPTIPPFRKLIRIAVAEGLKRMYKEYRLSKWLKVQEMANTVRRVLDGATTPSPGQVLGYRSPGEVIPIQHVSSPRQRENVNNNNWQVVVPEAYQWQPQSYTIQPSPESFIRLVSPIVSPGEIHVSAGQQFQLTSASSPHEFSIQLVENHHVRRQLNFPEHIMMRDSLHQQVDQAMTCAIQNVSGLSSASDDVLDSVNIVNPHGHNSSSNGHMNNIDNQPQSVPTNQAHPMVPSNFMRQPVLTSAQQEVVYQSAGYPTMPSQNYQHQQVLDNQQPQGPSDNQYQMDWEADYEDSDLEDDDDLDRSSYNDSEESLAGVLFAASHLLPDEQAVRLDVEMGDMGVGHMTFDRVSAAWYNAHCEFYRAN